MSKKSEKKPSDRNQDAALEISDEELKKVSGGVGAQRLRSARVGLRGNPIGDAGLRESATGRKLSR